MSRRLDRVHAHQVGGRLYRRLRPAAHRIRLEILLAQAPALSQIGPEIADLFALDHERRRAGEAGGGEVGGTRTRHRAPAGAILDHGGKVDAAHHLTARPVIFGDAQRLAGLCRIEAEAPRPDRRDAERVPRAGGVIVGGGAVGGDAGADGRPRSRPRDRSMKSCPAILPPAASAKASAPGSTAAPAWPLVRTWPSCASKASMVMPLASAAPTGLTRRPSNIRPAVVRTPAEMLGGMVADDPRQAGAEPGAGDADQVDEAYERAIDDLARQIAEPQLADEADGSLFHGSDALKRGKVRTSARQVRSSSWRRKSLMRRSARRGAARTPRGPAPDRCRERWAAVAGPCRYPRG